MTKLKSKYRLQRSILGGLCFGTILALSLILAHRFMYKSSALVTVKPQLTGFIDRHGPPSSSSQPIVKGFVIEADWTDIQPNNKDELITNNPNSPIDQQLAIAHQQGLAVKLRVYAGVKAPSWVKSKAGGPMHMVSVDNFGARTESDVPIFWESNVMQAYANLMAKLADKYDNDSALLEVSSSECTLFTGEPFIHNLQDDPANVTSFQSFGWTKKLDMACEHAGVDAMAVWQHTRSSFAVNPQQYIDANNNVLTDEPAAEAFLDYCRSQLGVRCVIGDNSLRDVPQAGKIAALRGSFKAHGAPQYFQTAQPGLYTNLEDVVQLGLDYGAAMIELPRGYESELAAKPAVYTTYENQLKANGLAAIGDATPPSSGQNGSGAAPTPAPVPVGAQTPNPNPSTQPSNVSQETVETSVAITPSQAKSDVASVKSLPSTRTKVSVAATALLGGLLTSYVVLAYPLRLLPRISLTALSRLFR